MRLRYTDFKYIGTISDCKCIVTNMMSLESDILTGLKMID